MRLVVISNMAHYRRADGVIVGHGATARELSAVASLFDEVRHVACLHEGPPPASARPYDAANVTLVPVPPAGGPTLRDKLAIARLTPRYVRTIRRELREADAVHVRAPANISLYAIVMLAVSRRPMRRWVKYAGAWRPTGPEPLFYRVQRRLLGLGGHRAEVTINGATGDDASFVHSFVNPCLTDAELAAGRLAARAKRLTPPLRLLFVGHLGAAKNPRVAIEALIAARAAGLDARLDLAGDGAELEVLRAEVARAGQAEHVTLHGALDRAALNALYARAHFVLLPSRTEGWPKVLGEGMAMGALPIATAVGSIPELLAQIGAGRTIPVPPRAQDLVTAIRAYVDAPEVWADEVGRAVDAAARFGYPAYVDAVRELLRLDA